MEPPKTGESHSKGRDADSGEGLKKEANKSKKEKRSFCSTQLQVFVVGSFFFLAVGLGLAYLEKENHLVQSILSQQVQLPDFVPPAVTTFLNSLVPDQLRALRRRPLPSDQEGIPTHKDTSRKRGEWFREDKFEVWKRDFGDNMPDPDTWPGTIKLLWYAPIWSGGGYGSEAIAIAQSLNVEEPPSPEVQEILNLRKRMDNKKRDLTDEERQEFLSELQAILTKTPEIVIPKVLISLSLS